MRSAIEKSGVQELENSFHTIRRDGAMLHICGLDDGWAGAADVSRVLQKLPKKGAAILLAHEPDFADDYAQANRFDAQLSGHTTAGKFAFPELARLFCRPTAGSITTACMTSGIESGYLPLAA